MVGGPWGHGHNQTCCTYGPSVEGNCAFYQAEHTLQHLWIGCPRLVLLLPLLQQWLAGYGQVLENTMFIYGPKNSSTMESDLSLQLSYGLGKKGNLANLQKQNVKVYKFRIYVQRSGVCMYYDRIYFLYNGGRCGSFYFCLVGNKCLVYSVQWFACSWFMKIVNVFVFEGCSCEYMQ